MWKINIIGGSVAGLTLAQDLSKRGWEVQVIEEHEKIGEPMQCAGLVSETGCAKAGIDLEGIVVNHIKGAKIFSPKGHQLKVEKKHPVACVIDRAALDKKVANKASKTKNVSFMLGYKLIGMRGDSLFLKHAKGRGEMIKSKYVVGADGPNSTVRDLAGYKIPKLGGKVHAMFAKAKMSVDPDFVQLYFGSIAPGFFAWVIPENKTVVRIGLGVTLGADISRHFDEFLDKLVLKKDDVYDLGSGLIPIGPPMDSAVKDNSLLVGDSAFQTKSTTGGGIITGVMSAHAAAEALDLQYSTGKGIETYDALWKKTLQKDLMLHWKIHDYISSLKDDQMDKLIVKANKSNLGEFLSEYGDMDFPTSFVPKMKYAGKLWRLTPELMKLGFK